MQHVVQTCEMLQRTCVLGDMGLNGGTRAIDVRGDAQYVVQPQVLAAFSGGDLLKWSASTQT
jgi:hypothetical protein